jgi:hypothetical protein
VSNIKLGFSNLLVNVTAITILLASAYKNYIIITFISPVNFLAVISTFFAASKAPFTDFILCSGKGLWALAWGACCGSALTSTFCKNDFFVGIWGLNPCFLGARSGAICFLGSITCSTDLVTDVGRST